MSAVPPTPTGPSLPVSSTFAEVYALLWSNRDDFLRIMLIPVGVSFMLAVIAYHVELGGALLIVVAADLIPTTLFAVGWNRLILLGPQRPAATLAWGSRETAFLWRSLLIVIGIATALAVPVSIAMTIAQRSAVGHLLFAAMSFAALFVMVRLSLVLPASAVDASYGFSQAWHDTTARGLQLVAIMLLVEVPMFLGIELFNGLTRGLGLTGAAPLTVIFLNKVGGYLLLAALMTVFALAFRRLSGWGDGAPPAVAGTA